MARLTESQKSIRLLQFLHGCGNPNVAPLLGQYGFAAQDWEEGWKLLRRANALRFQLASQPDAPVDPTPELVEWQSRWVPIIEATLRRRFPEIYRGLKEELRAPRASVEPERLRSLLHHIERLNASEQGREALKVLSSRGVSKTALDRATELLSLSSMRMERSGLERARMQRDLARASDEMWQWYQEWAGIARSVVTTRRELKALGFLAGKATEPELSPPLSSTSSVA